MDPLRYLLRLAARLRMCTTESESITLPLHVLIDMMPHYWREEAETRPEWWIRYGRAYGLHGSYDVLYDCIHFRLTKDAKDEATITWPGK
jgi:hypothetical protein